MNTRHKYSRTDTTVTHETVSADFALLVSDADSARSFVVSYEPCPTLPADDLHRHAFVTAVGLVRAEGLPRDAVMIEVMARRELPGCGRPYWAAVGRPYCWCEAVAVARGLRTVAV